MLAQFCYDHFYTIIITIIIIITITIVTILLLLIIIYIGVTKVSTRFAPMPAKSVE